MIVLQHQTEGSIDVANIELAVSDNGFVGTCSCLGNAGAMVRPGLPIKEKCHIQRSTFVPRIYPWQPVLCERQPLSQ